MRNDYDDDYGGAGQYGTDSNRAAAAEKLSMWAGAALGIALIGGLFFWVVGLGDRDVSEIPVIQAALQPEKVQPDDPGGAETAHQEIASYDAGKSQPPAIQVAFAPPPERPAKEDLAMGVLANQAVVTLLDAPVPTPAPSPVAVSVPRGEGTDLAPPISPVAPRRPADLSQRMAAVSAVDLADLAAASAVQIQLGAFPDRDQTKREWTRLYKANSDLLTGRALVMQSTISGGRRFFRMRAGPFKDRVEAQNVCRALQARGLDCLVAVNG